MTLPVTPSLSVAADATTRWCFEDGDSAPYHLHYTPSRGVHAVARRRLLPGDVVLIEPPLVSTRTEVAPGLPGDAPEWALVHALLTLGKRRLWASRFATLAEADSEKDDDDTAVVAWLRRMHGVSGRELDTLFQAVRSNAFGLETPLLGVEYGAALFPSAARFNHDCRPNCISVRISGNMAIFCGERAIAAGEELTHSYLPAHVLAQPRSRRAAQLHFACGCARCSAGAPERDDELDPGAATAVARFLLECAARGEHEPQAALRAGDALLDGRLLSPLLAPCAALEVARTYLGTYWTARACGATAVVAAAAPERVRAAAQLQADAAAALRSRADGGDALPRAQLALLHRAGIIQAFIALVEGGRDPIARDESQREARAALDAISAALGGGTAGCSWLLGDLPFLEPCAARALGVS